MPASRVNDPKHWFDRAEEVRAVAERMSDEQSRRAMLAIAEGYEHLAERAELRRSKPPSLRQIERDLRVPTAGRGGVGP